MTFDEILATVDGNGNGILPEGWGQGRALFGGLVGAVLFEHLVKSVAGGAPLAQFLSVICCAGGARAGVTA